jgi:CubicO group peptidase (beta-lactamase class C family)
MKPASFLTHLLLTAIFASPLLHSIDASANEVRAHDIHDVKTLEAFMDGVIQSSMEEHKVAGTVVSITTTDKVLLSKGYGYADVAKKVPVTPSETLFRIGSVSKLFVWLPIMQLVEQGKLDLDADVNEYLTSVKVPEAFGDPITIANLMTHTPGFEDHVIGLFGLTADSMRPLSEILNDEMPLRVRPPGKYASYSNHGVGIAGLIIEEVSGQSWPEYVDEHVLKPLDMNMTSMLQPLPERLMPYMSKGYRYDAGKYLAKDFEYVPLAPAGGTSATASDMTRFMQMFLNKGELEGTRILGEATAEKMQTTLFRPAPTLNGAMHGLYELSSHGQLIIGHGGDTIWFHSQLSLMPEVGIGIFISTNSASGPAVRAAIIDALLNRYYPAPAPIDEDFARTDLSKVVGEYSSIRHAHEDLSKIIKLMSPISITSTESGQLVLSGAFAGEHPAYFDEVAPLMFKRPGYETVISFELSDDGNASHLYLNDFPVIAFERMSGINSVSFNFFLLGFGLMISLWILIVWTTQHFTRRTVLPPALARFRKTGWLHAATVIVYLVSLSLAVSDETALVFGLTTGVKATLMWGWVVIGLSLALLLQAPAIVGSPDCSKFARAGYLMVTLASIGFSWFLVHWRLFTW